MFTHNDQAKALFPLSLDGRGARGEGVPSPVIPDGRQADPESIPGRPNQSPMGWKRPGFRMIAKAISGMTNGAFVAALFLAAPAAWADNECGLDDPTVNGALADSYDCPDADYPEGVTYAADGDLTINFTNADSPARSIIGENPDNGDDPTDKGGIDLSATGGDSITFDSATTATEIQSNGVIGALLGVTTADGNIDIDTEEVDADISAAGVTHGIFAQSTGAGDIGIVTTGSVDAQSAANPDNAIGIEARSNGGDIDISTGTVRGVQYGILAGTSGSGALTVAVDGSVQLPRSRQARESAVAAMDLTSGTGLLTVDVSGDSFIHAGGGSFNSSNPEIKGGIPMRTNAGGDQVINIAPGGRLRAFNRNTAMDLTAAGATVINNGGVISSFNFRDSVQVTTTQREMTAILVNGDTLVLNNDGRINGLLDFSSLDNGYEFNNNAGAEWSVNGPNSELGAGTLNNAGTIEFRSLLASTDQQQISKVFPATVVSAPGTAFTGVGDSRFEMYAFIDGTGQASCAEATTASCLDLTGGSTAGRTDIFLQFEFTTLVTGPLGAVTSAHPGIVLVDVNGGTSAAEHFVLDPASGFLDLPNVESRYAEDPIYGAVLDVGGMLDYSLLYNPETRQHVLASVPQAPAIEYAAYVYETASLWHTTADVVAGRQHDVRDGGTGNFWFRAAESSRERDATPMSTIQGNTFTYDHGYEIESRTAVFGLDLASDDDSVFGVYVGAATSRLDFDDSDSGDWSKGSVFGAYGGWWNDSGLSLDAMLHANFVKLDHDVTGFEESEVSYRSLGARLEAGWRMPLVDELLYVQPLATAAYVTTDIEDVELQDNTIVFDDAESMRAGLGVRLGGETPVGGESYDIGYWLAARQWEEHADEGQAGFKYREGGVLAIEDDRSGTFEEVELGVDFTTWEGDLSAYLSGGLASGDEDGQHVSVGVRLSW